MAERITNLRRIARYTGPQWLVQPGEELTGRDLENEMDAVNDGRIEVLDRNVAGWGDFNAIIRVHADGEWDYLARLEPLFAREVG